MENYDVAIIGGGPAGSTAATLLAKGGRRVFVCERDKFPRFHIGESLLPFSMATFSRMGVQEKFLKAGFIEKFGGEMMDASGTKAVKFLFKDGFRSKTDRSWQVTRAEFDKLLLDHSAECGASVSEETAVEAAEFDAEGVTLRVRKRGSDSREIRAKYLIDGSGRQSFLGSKFQLKKNYQHLQKISLFAHYDGICWEPPPDGTLTRMIRALKAWFWIVPLNNGRTSIGIVMDAADFKRARMSPEEFFDQAIAEQPIITDRIGLGRRISEVHVAADFSYRMKTLFGDRWLLAGDAAGFIDPVFSSGVFLAVLAGENAADALNQVLDYPNRRAKLFRGYEKLLNRAMDVYLRFVDAWYSKEFIEVFLHPQDRFQIPPAVNAVLGGNVGESFAIRWRMEIFYLIVRLQKRWALCPRLSLLPQRRPEVAATETAAA